jgi:hypothetical protein
MFITNVPYTACCPTQPVSRKTMHMDTDMNFAEVDEAGNVNNVMTVYSFGNSDPSQLGEPSDSDRDTKPSTQPASKHSKSPLLGLDGVDDSDEELARSLRKVAAVAGNTMAEFHGANGDIEPDNSVKQKGSQHDSKAHDVSDASITSSLPARKPESFVDKAATPEACDNDPSAASNASAETRELPIDRTTNTQNSEGKMLSPKPSVSTFSARTGQKDQKDFWLIQFCRVIVHGVVGSMSTLLCGKRRM